MIRYTEGDVHFHFKGDEGLGKTYVGYARALLNETVQKAKSAGGEYSTYGEHHPLLDGTIIHTIYASGLKLVTIDTSAAVPAKKIAITGLSFIPVTSLHTFRYGKPYTDVSGVPINPPLGTEYAVSTSYPTIHYTRWMKRVKNLPGVPSVTRGYDESKVGLLTWKGNNDFDVLTWNTTAYEVYRNPSAPGSTPYTLAVATYLQSSRHTRGLRPTWGTIWTNSTIPPTQKSPSGFGVTEGKRISQDTIAICNKDNETGGFANYYAVGVAIRYVNDGTTITPYMVRSYYDTQKLYTYQAPIKKTILKGITYWVVSGAWVKLHDMIVPIIDYGYPIQGTYYNSNGTDATVVFARIIYSGGRYAYQTTQFNYNVDTGFSVGVQTPSSAPADITTQWDNVHTATGVTTDGSGNCLTATYDVTDTYTHTGSIVNIVCSDYRGLQLVHLYMKAEPTGAPSVHTYGYTFNRAPIGGGPTYTIDKSAYTTDDWRPYNTVSIYTSDNLFLVNNIHEAHDTPTSSYGHIEGSSSSSWHYDSSSSSESGSYLATSHHYFRVLRGLYADIRSGCYTIYYVDYSHTQDWNGSGTTSAGYLLCPYTINRSLTYTVDTYAQNLLLTSYTRLTTASSNNSSNVYIGSPGNECSISTGSGTSYSITYPEYPFDTCYSTHSVSSAELHLKGFTSWTCNFYDVMTGSGTGDSGTYNKDFSFGVNMPVVPEYMFGKEGVPDDYKLSQITLI